MVGLIFLFFVERINFFVICFIFVKNWEFLRLLCIIFRRFKVEIFIKECRRFIDMIFFFMRGVLGVLGVILF